MIISIIAILLLAGKVLSSLSSLVQGSISINDDTILLDLSTNKLSDDDDMVAVMYERIAKLKTRKANLRIHLMIDIGRRVIEMNGGTDRGQDYFDIRFDKVTEVNVANDFINTRVPELREISCDTCNDNFARRKIVASRLRIMNKLIDDISDILQHMATVMQKRDDSMKLTHQDSTLRENLHNFQFIISQGYQNSIKTPINISQESEYIASSPIFSNDNSRSKLFFEYIKAVQDGLSWLSKLFDIKWRQSYDDFDNTSVWRLLNLQKQAEFLLANLIEENQQQHDETKSKKYQNFTRDRNIIYDVLNAKEIKKEKATLLDKQDGKNLNKIDRSEINKNEPQETDHELTGGQVTPKVETRIMSYPELLKEINNRNKSSTTIKINPLNQEFIINKFPRGKNNSIINDVFPIGIKVPRNKHFIPGKTSLADQGNLNKSTKTPHNKSLATGFETKNRFSQLKNRSTILPSENITNTLKEIDQQKRTRTDAMLQESLKKIVTGIPSRRTLQNILIPSDKNVDQKQKNQHVPKKKIADNRHRSNERIKTSIDSISAMDEIMEAVGKVLPTERSVESPLSRELKVTP